MSKRIGKTVLLSALCACIFFHAVRGCLRYGESSQEQECEESLDEVSESLENTAPGTINQAGLYKDVKKLSLYHQVEANHIPPKSCIEAVDLYSNIDHHVALSTAYDVHRRAGTTRYPAVRNKITEYLKEKNIVGALKLQICEDYIDTDSFEVYDTGLLKVIKILSCLPRNDGALFLSTEEYDEMISFLTGEPSNMSNDCRNDELDEL